MNPLRALLAAIVDYAGLFPPAALDMPAAIRNYAAYLASDDAWMLGRFVVSTSRLDEFRASHERLGGATQPAWHLSALLGDDMPGDVRAIAAFNERAHGHVVIDSVEGKLATEASMREIGALADGAFSIFAELPVQGDREALIETAARLGINAKLRTGGVTRDAFPTADRVVGFIRLCIDRGVRFKCTAGLHHPLTAEYRLTYQPTSETGRMFGFLNVFLTAAAIMQGASDGDAVQMLGEGRAAALSSSDDLLGWASARFDAATLERLRDDVAVSFGSCSFTEPLEGLRELALLSLA
jgi:hypothetical protein